ncbi:MAG TPA: peptide deformylase, partial [Methylophilus sp.]
MAIRSVLKMGDPLLFQAAAKVDAFDTPALHALIQDM